MVEGGRCRQMPMAFTEKGVDKTVSVSHTVIMLKITTHQDRTMTRHEAIIAHDEIEEFGMVHGLDRMEAAWGCGHSIEKIDILTDSDLSDNEAYAAVAAWEARIAKVAAILEAGGLM